MVFAAEQFQLLNIHRSAIEKYSLQSVLNHSFSDSKVDRMAWAQESAHKINSIRSATNGGSALSHADLYALSLLQEAYLRLLFAFKSETKNRLFTDIIDEIEKSIGSNHYKKLSETFNEEYPDAFIDAHKHKPTGTLSIPELVFQKMLVTRLHSINPAAVAFSEFFDTQYLSEKSSWIDWIQKAEKTLKKQFVNEANSKSLFDLLMEPMRASPASLEMQLRYIAEHWQVFLGDFSKELLKGADSIREVHRPFFGGPGPSLVPDFDSEWEENEAFSEDHDWMSELVLLAKNVYVWLEQLSREYGYAITTLDAIPDDALLTLAKRGFKGLWLIGLWSRSHASQRIKQLCGNPEAAASAYAVYDYSIAEELGGDTAFSILKQRARTFGIRLAGDMVPNHMGIDSKWVCDHPEWFISIDYNPFPHYTYNGVDLSSQQNCSIYLEDHYYTRSDAAVVFKHVDHSSGKIRYIYHGNDGTGLPWNDTAQLDYLQTDVREKVIQTILEVAKKFPIIRFDAAMTLAKQHFHRLWYPEPGSGGDIATRSWFGISKQQLDRHIPTEFWREVVDRVAVHAPGTLLLAEAFWLMESYFVRTLGMHRVYNSSFMNMLAKEENAKYRDVVKQTIAFDPEILKRYVNFMNNPDEEPAVIQFGKGDKYFGICAMMSTMPGLPMFGHGQFEGFEEKYGMEYRRSYWNESPDPGFVAHHHRIITPLLKNRRLFSGVTHFRLYDFIKNDHQIDENVFAYSNYADDKGMIFIFNNSVQSTQGKIHVSSQWRVKTLSEEGVLRKETLGTALALSGNLDRYVKFYDVVTQRWFIRNCSVLTQSGLGWHLSPYQFHVFIGFSEVEDTVDHKYQKLEKHLGGSGCIDLEEEWIDLQHLPFMKVTSLFFTEAILNDFKNLLQNDRSGIQRVKNDYADILRSDLEKPSNEFAHYLSTEGKTIRSDDISDSIINLLVEDRLAVYTARNPFPGYDRLLILWHGLIQTALKNVLLKHDIEIDSFNYFWRSLKTDLLKMGIEEKTASTITEITDRFVETITFDQPFEPQNFFRLDEVQRWIHLNIYRGVRYFNKEAFDELLDWGVFWGAFSEKIRLILTDLAQYVGYKYEEFLDGLKSKP